MLAELNSFISGCGDVLAGIIALLPKSPFTAYTDVSLGSQLLSFINWIVPVGTMISILEAWVTAIAVWYIIQIILRWVKAIE